MDKKLLLECITFEADPRMLKEAMAHPNQPFKVSGILQRKGKKNQNGRIYPDGVLEREVDKYLRTFVADRRAMGELDHPESSVVNLKNVSHNVIEMHWQGDDLVGTVEILTTPNGNILRELFRNGIKLGISSRGLGTLEKTVQEGTSIVGDDFELIAFDFVSNPSTQGAFMAPNSQVSLSEGIVNSSSNRWEKADDIIHNILNELG
jgi:hypothetical protein